MTDAPAPDLSWTWYVEGVAQRGVPLDEAVAQARSGNGYVWFGLRDPDAATMRRLGRQIDLHELAVEDAVEGHERSKLEVFDDTLFMVISTVDYVGDGVLTATSEIVSTGQIMVFVGPWFAITSRHGGRAQMKSLRASLEADPGTLADGPWRVLYAVLDLVVDDFTETVTEMENDVEDVEAAVFARTGTHEVDRPYQLKRELIEFKRSMLPLSAPLMALHTRSFAMIPPEAQAYFREVHDHLQLTRESTQALDEVLGTILQAALARASVADNEDMRKISAAVAILAVPTTIGAIYGMNFENMPELHTRYGYFVVLAVMLVLMVITYVFFRKNRWL